MGYREQANRDAYKILESDEFNTLLDAVELMAKAQGSLLSLQKSVEELKAVVEKDNGLSNDGLSLSENAEICRITDDVSNLVDDLVYYDK